MKKRKLFSFILLFASVGILDLSSISYSYTPDFVYNPKGKIYTVDTTHFITASEWEISRHLKVKLEKYHRNWHKDTISYATRVISLGESLYGVRHETMLNIMDIESEFDIRATGTNRNDRGEVTSVDYSLTQINSKELGALYKEARNVLDSNNIWHGRGNFDIGLNIMASFIHINDKRQEWLQLRIYSFERLVKSYNCGVNGANEYLDPLAKTAYQKARRKVFKERRERYWTKYCKASDDFCLF